MAAKDITGLMATMDDTFWNRIGPSVVKAISRRQKWEITVCCFVIGLAIAEAEHLVSGSISLAVLYVIPVSILAWYVDLATALIFSVICIILWAALVAPLSVPTFLMAMGSQKTFFIVGGIMLL